MPYKITKEEKQALNAYLNVTDPADVMRNLAEEVMKARKGEPFSGADLGYLLPTAIKGKQYNILKEFSSGGGNPFRSAVMSLAEFPLVRNADGKVSALQSLRAITNPTLQSLVVVIAYTTSRSHLVASNTDKDREGKNMLDAMDVSVPLWMYVHKKKNNVPYEDWSLAEEDKPLLALGTMLYEGIMEMREGLFEKVEPFIGTLRQEQIDTLKEKNKTLTRKKTEWQGNAIQQGASFTWPAELAGKKMIIYQILLQLGPLHPRIVARSPFAIRNFLDLDAPAKALKTGNIPARDVNEAISSGQSFEQLDKGECNLEWNF